MPIAERTTETAAKTPTRPEPVGGRPTADIRAVSPGYFETMGIRLARGRDFGTDDGRGAPPVAVVNEPFVRRFLPGGDPVGRRLAIDVGKTTIVAEVVGVVAGVRQYS